MAQKDLFWVGTSKADLKSFPDDAKRVAGYQIRRAQSGMEPTDWKPMKTVGQGVREIRISEGGNAYRVFYVLVSKEGLYILHAFQKTTEQTEKKDIDLAKRRYREVKGH